MAVAAATHHGSGREVEERELHVAPRRKKPPPPGMRPASLAEPQGSQEQIQQHTVEQFVDLAPMVQTCSCVPLVQILDAPVPQLVEQLADVLVRVDEVVRKQNEEEGELRRRKRRRGRRDFLAMLFVLAWCLGAA